MSGRNSRVVDRVEWFEGMLLAPQHFQLMSARVDALVAWQTLAAAPFSWGVRRLVFDHGLLPAGLVRVLELDAILPDGTAVQYDAQFDAHYDAQTSQTGPLELSLEPYAAELSAGPLDFYLCLPAASAARSNAQVKRFRSVAGEPVDDEVSDAPSADIARLVPNLELSAGRPPTGAYVHLRLGSLYKDNEVVRLGARQPPLLEIAPDNPLWTSASTLLGQLRGKAAFVARQTANPSSRIDDRLMQLELKDRLRSLLTGLPLAEAVLRAPHLHPLTLYLALAALSGSLALLKPGGLPPVLPDYDHADPQAVFAPVLLALREAVSEVNEDHREHKFEFRQDAFGLVLGEAWIGKRLVVGLRGQADRDLLAWMEGAVIGSQPVYASLRSRRVLGAARRQIEYAEELGVRSGSGYLLFEIAVDAALVMAGEAIFISNSNEGESAQRPKEIVLFVKE